MRLLSHDLLNRIRSNRKREDFAMRTSPISLVLDFFFFLNQFFTFQGRHMSISLLKITFNN